MHDLTQDQIIGIATSDPTIEESLVKGYVEYHSSQQFIVLSDRQEKYLPDHGSGSAKSLSNMCRRVVLTLTDFINIVRFLPANTAQPEYAKWVNELFKENKLQEKQSELYKFIFRDGRAGLFVEQNEDGIIMRPFPIFNGDNTDKNGDYQANVRFHRHSEGADPVGVGYRFKFPDYDTTGETTEETLRLNFYYLDNNGGPISLYRLIGEDESDLALMTEDELAKELHNDGDSIRVVSQNPEILDITRLPIIEFNNEDRESELFEIMRLQDLINKATTDADIIADFHARPLFTVETWLGKVDGDGQPLPLDFSDVDMVPAVGFRRIEAADLEKIWKGSYERWVSIIAQIKGWPLWVLNPTSEIVIPASGRALEIALGPLIKQVTARQLNFLPGWIDVFELAREYAEDAPEGEIDIEWMQNSTLSLEEAQEKQIANANNAGLSFETMQRDIYGYNDDDVKEERKRKMADSAIDFVDQMPDIDDESAAVDVTPEVDVEAKIAEEDTPENIATTNSLNGAQAAEGSNTTDKLLANRMPGVVGKEFLLGLGFSDESSEIIVKAMVEHRKTLTDEQRAELFSK